MLAGLTPIEVNERLKRVGGFNDDLVIWQKINEAIPWLRFVDREKVYINDTVKSAIQKNQACLVEVDFDGKISSPSDSHWVLYIGNKRMYDPWTGVEKDTTYYPITKGYAVIDVVSTPPADVPQQPTITPQTKIDLGNTYGTQEVQAIISMLTDKDRMLKAFDETMNGLHIENSGLKTEISTYKSQQQAYAIKLGCADNHPAILAEIEKLIKTEDQINQVGKSILDYIKSLFKR